MMKRKLLALAVVLALCSGCQSESTGTANLPQYESLIFRHDVEKAQPEETKQKEKTVLPQNLKQALKDYCRVVDQAKKDGLIASRTGDDEEKPDYLPLERLAQGKALDGEEEDQVGQVYEDIACTGGETMKELLQRLEQAGFTGVTKCQKQESVISRGLSFWLDEELDVYFSYYQNVVPQSYEHFINETLKDGLYLCSLRQGGYSEVLVFASAQVQSGQPWCQVVTAVFEKGKLDQIQITAAAHKKNDSPFFAENQKETMKNMIASLTGNEKEAEQFVTNLKASTSVKGSIGGKTYTKKPIQVSDEYAYGYNITIQ